MTARVNVHATCVALGTLGAPFGGPPDAAVLIFGASGNGKSDLALRLIAGGALLVADDQTLLTIAEGRLYAEAPETISGLIEIRGVGIVSVPFAKRAAVVLAIRLLEAGAPERLPEPNLYVPPFPLVLPAHPVPVIALHAFEASAPAKTAAAASSAANGRFVAGVTFEKCS